MHLNPFDFENQADGLLKLLEGKISREHRQAALILLRKKLQSVYEQGIAQGRRYEQTGAYPYNDLDQGL